jgi:hypothetical protein
MKLAHRHFVFWTRLLFFALAGQGLLGEVHAALQREGDSAILTDRPRCRFAWPNWDNTNITNPLLLTKNTLDKSLIGIMRVRAGDTLPKGKTGVSATMSTQQIAALLRENVQGRGQRGRVAGSRRYDYRRSSGSAIEIRTARQARGQVGVRKEWLLFLSTI